MRLRFDTGHALERRHLKASHRLCILQQRIDSCLRATPFMIMALDPRTIETALIGL